MMTVIQTIMMDVLRRVSAQAELRVVTVSVNEMNNVMMEIAITMIHVPINAVQLLSIRDVEHKSSITMELCRFRHPCLVLENLRVVQSLLSQRITMSSLHLKQILLPIRFPKSVTTRSTVILTRSINPILVRPLWMSVRSVVIES